jgi:starch synthase
MPEEKKARKRSTPKDFPAAVPSTKVPAAGTQARKKRLTAAPVPKQLPPHDALAGELASSIPELTSGAGAVGGGGQKVSEPAQEKKPPRSRAGASKPARRPATRKAVAEPAPASEIAPSEAAPVTETSVDVLPAPPLSVLMVTSEAHPFAKTGGLAEVSASLTDALSALGHHVTLVLPRYRAVAVDDATERLQTRVRLGDRLQPVTFYERRVSERVMLVLVDVPELFDREGLYGDARGDYPDNALRFAIFSRAALEYPRLCEERPSIIHAHDWQTGLVPVYQKMHLSSDPFVGGVPAVFTLHNLAFQGIFPASTLPSIGLGYEVLDVQGMEFWGNISYLKGGINFSEKITTVSPGYAREIVRPELGFGFDGVLARRSADLVGILNGIDTSRWTPTSDQYVPASFSAEELRGKRDAKRALLTSVNLPSDAAALARPVIGLVSRLTDQKGFDLITDALATLMARDAAWVMLGSGESRYEESWRALASAYPDRVSTTIGFDERLAHLIEAGADMFLMPSRFEPCGLNQLYSLRYGTVPVVRATGGLSDTVEDADAAPESGTGFAFRDYTRDALVDALDRALAAFQDPVRWAAIERRGMRKDHSWDASAREYVKVYRAMLNAEG